MADKSDNCSHLECSITTDFAGLIHWHMLRVHLLHLTSTETISHVIKMETKYHVLCWYHLVVHHELLQQLWVIYKGRRHLTSNPHSCKQENQDASMWWNQEHHKMHFMNERPDDHKSDCKLMHVQDYLIHLYLFAKISMIFIMKI